MMQPASNEYAYVPVINMPRQLTLFAQLVAQLAQLSCTAQELLTKLMIQCFTLPSGIAEQL